MEKDKKFNPVNKTYTPADYKSNNEEEKGLSQTHEQVSDSYMIGDVTTHDPSCQDKE